MQITRTVNTVTNNQLIMPSPVGKGAISVALSVHPSVCSSVCLSVRTSRTQQIIREPKGIAYPNLEGRYPTLYATRVPVSRSNGQRSGLQTGGGIPCRPNPAATLLVYFVQAKYQAILVTSSSSSCMRVMSHWSATKQRLHPQSVAEISRHSVLSGNRIRQCGTVHRLGLATRTQVSVCKSPFPSAGTAVSLFCAKTVQ